MIKIISPDQFKTIPWKNGLGQTTELAISPAGTLDDFDWRLSIASVVENGLFSDFSGYQRQLVLLDGGGIKLTHDERQVDELVEPLSMAIFDGSCQTVGELINGPIHDFNVMSKQNSYKAEVNTYSQQQTIKTDGSLLCFFYAAFEHLQIKMGGQIIQLPEGHLLQIKESSTEATIIGSGFIVIVLNRLK